MQASPLSQEDRHNIEIIFNTLNTEKQLHILSNWEIYLEKILTVRGQAEAERKKSIKHAFDRINTLIDDAYLRDQEAKKQQALAQAQRQEEYQSSLKYDQMRRNQELEKMRNDQIEARQKLADPLAFI